MKTAVGLRTMPPTSATLFPNPALREPKVPAIYGGGAAPNSAHLFADVGLKCIPAVAEFGKMDRIPRSDADDGEQAQEA